MLDPAELAGQTIRQYPMYFAKHTDHALRTQCGKEPRGSQAGHSLSLIVVVQTPATRRPKSNRIVLDSKDDASDPACKLLWLTLYSAPMFDTITAELTTAVDKLTHLRRFL